MAKWKYTQITVTDRDMGHILKNHGDVGWELAAVTRGLSKTGEDEWDLFFKMAEKTPVSDR